MSKTKRMKQFTSDNARTQWTLTGLASELGWSTKTTFRIAAKCGAMIDAVERKFVALKDGTTHHRKCIGYDIILGE